MAVFVEIEMIDLDQKKQKGALLALATRDLLRERLVEVALVAQVGGLVDGDETTELARDVGEACAMGLDAPGELAILQYQARAFHRAGRHRDQDIDVVDGQRDAVVRARG